MFKLVGLLTFALSVYHVQGLCESEPLARKVSAEDRALIVEQHNKLRGLLLLGAVRGQPKAKYMKTIKWDSDLADEAQKIANTCEFEHVKVIDSRWKVGQNLAWSASSDEDDVEADWKSGILQWFDEHTTYIFGSSVFNHYTQVVWADTEYIGCGYTAYMSDGWLEKLYVCNYGPAGNFQGEEPYQTG